MLRADYIRVKAMFGLKIPDERFTTIDIEVHSF